VGRERVGRELVGREWVGRTLTVKRPIDIDDTTSGVPVRAPGSLMLEKVAPTDWADRPTGSRCERVLGGRSMGASVCERVLDGRRASHRLDSLACGHTRPHAGSHAGTHTH
jgi:hypothetical protein